MSTSNLFSIIVSFAIVFFIIILSIVLPIIRSYFLFRKTVVLEAKITPFERDIPNAPMKILVLGDSTAVGTGVDDTKLSTAGRLGTLYPQASVVNLAQNGLRLQGLLDILADRAVRPADEHFDLILIQIGANDIIRLTNSRDIENKLMQVLDRVKEFGGKVIVLHSGNVGKSLFFPWYVRPIISHKSYQVRDIYMKVIAAKNASAGGADIHYVDLIKSDAEQKLEQDLKRYYAADYLHLSGEGYGVWFDEIKKVL